MAGLKPSLMALIKAILINGCVDLKGHYGGSSCSGVAEFNVTGKIAQTKQTNETGEGIKPRGDEFGRIYKAPSTWQGFGRVDLSNSLLLIERYNISTTYTATGFHDASSSTIYGLRPIPQCETWSVDIFSQIKMLSVTLCYYDATDDQGVLQNQLNLTVRQGLNTCYGNAKGRNVGYPDQVNNTQKVVWEREPGDCTIFEIKVHATHIATDYPQPFAVAWMSHE